MSQSPASRWCDLCEMTMAYCPHGNVEAARAVEAEFGHARHGDDCTGGEDGPTIEASIPGRCVTCDAKIEVGDRITHVTDGWVHAKPERDETGLFEGI